MRLSSLFKLYSNSVKTRLIVNIVFVHAVLMSLVVFDLVNKERGFIKEQVSVKGYEITSLLASNAAVALLNNDLVALDELLQDMNRVKSSYLVFIFDKFGVVKASTDKSYFNQSLYDSVSKEIFQKLKDSKDTSYQISHNESTDTVTAVKVDGRTVGYVRTVLNTGELKKELVTMTQEGFIYVFFAILLGAFFAWMSVRKTTSYLNKVALAADKIANKDFNVDLPKITSDDEISKMVKAFHIMTESIDEYIADLQKSNELIHHEKELAEITLKSIGDAVIVTDAQGYVKFINPAAQIIVKYTTDEAKGVKIEKLFTLLDSTNSKIASPVYSSISDEKTFWFKESVTLIDREENRYFIEDSSAPIIGLNGKIEGAVFVFHDVTQKKKDETHLKWQTTHDELTKLNNRLGFNVLLENLCKQISRQDTTHSLLFMDLDKFKIINDTAGHLAGDEVLKQVANLLKRSVREEDFLCRFGGDEFGLILINSDVESSKIIAQQLIDTVLEYTFIWNDKNFKIGLSIGISTIDKTHYNPTMILSNADLACYKAKDLGRNRYYVAKESDLSSLENEHEINWVNRINKAIRNKNFVLYVQKIKDLFKDNDHYEVLLRLNENGTVISPDSFLPHAEHYALMPKIDRYVIEEFFRWFSANQERVKENIKFSLNITGQSLSEIDFADDVLVMAKNYGIDCRRIIFEITESTAISNISDAQKLFEKLGAAGFRFSLDDFGTGLSSFAYLKSLPISFLKIDGVFIKNIVTDKIDRGMVESIYKISSIMNLKVIAEYVENDEIVRELREIGIDYAQGYAVEKPKHIDALLF